MMCHISDLDDVANNRWRKRQNEFHGVKYLGILSIACYIRSRTERNSLLWGDYSTKISFLSCLCGILETQIWNLPIENSLRVLWLLKKLCGLWKSSCGLLAEVALGRGSKPVLEVALGRGSRPVVAEPRSPAVSDFLTLFFNVLQSTFIFS